MVAIEGYRTLTRDEPWQFARVYGHIRNGVPPAAGPENAKKFGPGRTTRAPSPLMTQGKGTDEGLGP